MNPPTAPAQPVDLATESVAGEEDPGASLDLPKPVAAPVPATPPPVKPAADPAA